MEMDLSKPMQAYQEKLFELEQFLSGVLVFFEKHPKLNAKPFPIIHSLKSRFKEKSHIEDKIKRKFEKGITITEENFFSEITDLIGVRVLHLYQDQFPKINDAIKSKITSGDWALVEPPKAYTWDPESESFYKELGLETEIKSTFYTSIHYLVKPNNSNNVCCEIQVRTLFEEVWGEIDHTINYPKEIDSVSCKEQLRVLAKLVSTGTRLADSIFRTHEEHKRK